MSTNYHCAILAFWAKNHNDNNNKNLLIDLFHWQYFQSVNVRVNQLSFSK